MFHTRIPSVAWAGILIFSGVSGAMAQAPIAQRQTPTQANKVVGSSPATGTLPAPVSYTHLDVYKRQGLRYLTYFSGRQATLRPLP